AEALHHHSDLYALRKMKRGTEVFLDVRGGLVRTDSLQGVGFGTTFEPDWSSMTPLENWQVIW
ncbi:MAG: hypothetical protein ACPGVU_20545, partial [Limisphaerales bacterium]